MTSILFLGKADDEHVDKALTFCAMNFDDVTACIGRWGDPLPPAAVYWEGDYIISYLSRWVVPAHLLQRARWAAINFHPASPDYPGAGCNNFALYEGATEYGITCHHMAPQVDTGPIIAVKRFPVYATDTVASLLARSYAFQLALFYEVMAEILANRELPRSSEAWTRAPFRKADIDRLARIAPGMSRDEIARRVRATTFGEWRPVVELQGYTFELKAEG
jgi:methionyl-tRNA formyltransferase